MMSAERGLAGRCADRCAAALVSWVLVAALVVVGASSGASANSPGAAALDPLVLSGLVLKDAVRLSWVLPVTGYTYDMDVERVDEDGNVLSTDWVDGDLPGKKPSAWTVRYSNLDPGVTYRYRVRLQTEDHGDLVSNTVALTPSDQPAVPPGSLVAEAADGEIALDWVLPEQPVWLDEPAAMGVARMRVFRSADSGAFNGAALATVPIVSGASEYSYTDTEVLPGNTYWYQVELTYGLDDLVSNEATATVPVQVSEANAEADVWAEARSQAQTFDSFGGTVALTRGIGYFRVNDPQIVDGELVGEAESLPQATYLTFDLDEASSVRLAIRARGSERDLFLTLEDGDGNEIATADTLDTPVQVLVNALNAGTYFMRIELSDGDARCLDEDFFRADYVSHANRLDDAACRWTFAMASKQVSELSDDDISATDYEVPATAPAVVAPPDSGGDNGFSPISAEFTIDEASLSWDAPDIDDVTEWVLQRSANGNPWTDLHTATEEFTSYTDRSVQPSSVYYYRLRLTTAEGTATSPPTAAANPGHIAVGHAYISRLAADSVTVSWHPVADTDTIDGYRIYDTYEYNTYEKEVIVATVGRDVTKFTHTVPRSPFFYSYTVKPFSSQGSGLPSYKALAFVAPLTASRSVEQGFFNEASEAPARPQRLFFERSPRGDIELHWTATQGAMPDGYEIRRTNWSGATRHIDVISVSGTYAVAFVDRTFRNGSVSYEIRAVNDHGASEWKAAILTESLRVSQDGSMIGSPDPAPSETEPSDQQLAVSAPSGFDLHDHNASAQAADGDGQTMWVLDIEDDWVYSYSLATGERSDRDVDLNWRNNDPRGIWTDGTTMWVSDKRDRTIYAYDIDDGRWGIYTPWRNIRLDREQGSVRGLWSDGETLWAADYWDDKLYAYALATGERDSARDIDLATESRNYVRTDIWSDGDTVWVVYPKLDRVRAYDMATGQRRAADDLDASRSEGAKPYGVWADGTHMWIADRLPEPGQVLVHEMSALAEVPFDVEDAKPTDLRLDLLHNALRARFTQPVAGDPDHYLIEWRSGEESYSPGRSKTASGTSRTIKGLENGTEYTVRVSAVDSEGNVGPGVEQTGTPMHFRDYIEEKFIDPNVEAFPWLQEAWYDEPIRIEFKEDDWGAYGLYYMNTKIVLTFMSYRSEGIVLHELAHHYTMSEDIHLGDAEARLGVLSGWLLLAADGDRNQPHEAYAGALSVRVTAPNRYNSDSAMDQVMHHAGQGTIPQWFYDTYSTDGTLDGVDHDRLWADIRKLRCLKGGGCHLLGQTVANHSRGLFGGLCSHHEARNVLWGDSIYHSPWVDGGCKNRRPQDLNAHLADDDSAIEVTWSAPLYATTPSIDRYVVQWKSDTQSYDTSRQAIITDLTDLSYTITGLTSDVDYTVRVAAANSADATDFDDDDGHSRTAETVAVNPTPPPGFDLAALNSNPDNIWSDGTTMWVADKDDDKLYAYSLADGSRNASSDIDLPSGNDDPRGIWSDGTTMWIADTDDDKLYAYSLADGSRDASSDINLHSDNADPRGIWSDGTTMWVVDSWDEVMYAYVLDTGARDASKDTSLYSDSALAIHVDVWANESTYWVADWSAGEIYAHSWATGRHDADRDIDPSDGEDEPVGIWSDGTWMWIVDDDTLAVTVSALPEP